MTKVSTSDEAGRGRQGVTATVVIRSRRNRVLGASMMVVSLVLLMALAAPGIRLWEVTCVALCSLPFLYMAANLLASSTVVVSQGSVSFNARLFKWVSVKRATIVRAELTHRFFLYDRVYPTLVLTSGETVNVTQFEQPAKGRPGAAHRLVEALGGV